MLEDYEETVATSTQFDGAAGTGLVCTGTGGPTAARSKRTRLLQLGFRTASGCDLDVQLYDDSETPVLMATLVDESSVTSYLTRFSPPLEIPPGWTVRVVTASKTADGTAWAVYEVAAR